MSLPIYMDVHVRSAITHGLRRRGVAVLTAQENGATLLVDPLLLDRATALGYVLFTDAEATRRQRAGESFGGVVYAHQIRVTIGRCIADLEILAKVCEPADFMDRVEYLPL